MVKTSPAISIAIEHLLEALYKAEALPKDGKQLTLSITDVVYKPGFWKNPITLGNFKFTIEQV